MARARSCYMIGWLDEAGDGPIDPSRRPIRSCRRCAGGTPGSSSGPDGSMRLAACFGRWPRSPVGDRAASRFSGVEMLEGDLPAARRRLELVLADESSEIRPRRNAAFNLARICDRLDDPDAAFEAAAVGHAIRPSSFDPDAYDRGIDDLIDRFDAAWFENAPIGNLATEQAVLIVGLRSGTSLLEQIIASHPRAGGVGERQDPFLIMQNIEHSRRFGHVASPDDLDLEGRAYVRMLQARDADLDRVVNKALGLERTLGWMARVLPHARVVRIDRDPRDNLLRSSTRSARSSIPGPRPWITSSASRPASPDSWTTGSPSSRTRCWRCGTNRWWTIRKTRDCFTTWGSRRMMRA